MLGVLADHFAAHDVVVGKPIRIAANNVKWGVTSDEGAGDDWPAIREQILAADILIFGTPIWMGQPSSVAKLVLERMDAFLDETDDRGRMPSYSKVAVVAIVGNEDGAHHVSSQLFQSLNDVGWTIPAVAACYWVGEANGLGRLQRPRASPAQGNRNREDGCGQCFSFGPTLAERALSWMTAASAIRRLLVTPGFSVRAACVRFRRKRYRGPSGPTGAA
jgi:multimeric flavodoxin WrbA